MEVESPFARIARTRADFRAKHDAAGDDLVAEIDRHLEARIAADQLLQFASLEFEKAESRDALARHRSREAEE